MTAIKEKNEYLAALAQEIKVSPNRAMQVQKECESIFKSRLEKGQTEEEICWSLGPPREFAAAFFKNKVQQKRKLIIMSALRIFVSIAVLLFSFVKVTENGNGELKWIFGIIRYYELKLPLFTLIVSGLFWLIWHKGFAEPGIKRLNKERICHFVCLAILLTTSWFYITCANCDYANGELPLFFKLDEVGPFLSNLFRMCILFLTVLCFCSLSAAIRNDMRYFRVACHCVGVIFGQLSFILCQRNFHKISWKYAVSIALFSWAAGLFAALLATLPLKKRSARRNSMTV